MDILGNSNNKDRDEQAELQWQECQDNEVAKKRGYSCKAQMEDDTDAKHVWAQLSGVNVNAKAEKKNGLTYLSWAWAHAEVKKLFPDVNYKTYENAQGWNYHTDGRTCWVKVGAVIRGQEYIEMLPVMDFRNKSIPLDKVTSFDVNKAIQRAKTKAVALHGLGLYIYAGEDLPEESFEERELKKYKALYKALLVKKHGLNIPQDEIEKAKAMTLQDFKAALK